MKEPEIIAEIGVNYYDISKNMRIQLMDAAKEMILKCKEAGINLVKFQTYKADKLAADYSPAYWDLSEEPTSSQKELFSKFDKLEKEDYQKLAEYCKQTGVEFMSTPFDFESADFINPLVKRHKVASADITNFPLLEKIARFGKPVILSTGASKLEEIKEAVNLLEKEGAEGVTLLHCVLSYPTAYENANLWKIISMKKHFSNYKIGISDHSIFSADLLISAWLLGAVVIEKHFTLDKNLKGNDHYHAADVKDFLNILNKIKFLKKVYGREENNWLLECEKDAYRNARRGAYLSLNVKKGEQLKIEHVSFLRPQLDGLTPKQLLDCYENKSTYSSNLNKGILLRKKDVICN